MVDLPCLWADVKCGSRSTQYDIVTAGIVVVAVIRGCCSQFISWFLCFWHSKPEICKKKNIKFNPNKHYMDFVARNPISGVSNYVRLQLACSAAENVQKIETMHVAS